MTLIISLLSKRVVAHASDTRHTYISTRTSEPVSYEDKKVKSITILGEAGCFLVSYCGRGQIDSLTTDVWLTNLMTDFGAGTKKIGETINHLLVELKKRTNMSMGYHKLTIVISGVEIRGERGGISQYVVSNFERNINGQLVQGDIGEFQVHYLKRKTPDTSNSMIAMVLGAEAATTNRLFNNRMKKTIRILRAWRPGKNEDLKLALAQLIKIASRDANFGKYISESCIITIIPMDTWEPESTHFNSPTDKEAIAPHLIGPHISFRDVRYSGGSDLTLHVY